ncbi:alpha/beta fold hydrolase [Metabacillus arenae]|uniref:Alpha/beta fold hydrolase n=1 Tax=Metabacillus arenae TaxID=2771434 RepID=A0A926NLS1_9BACI|nr:alpha/beta fold hydrolase [Metabacillus arenae]MBD1382298.1 alpha/beta fold hydrolase [Metabacillus arenae]
MKSKKRLLIGLALMLTIALLFFITKNKQSTASYEINKTPTLFIHGYTGTERSFKGMISRFENKEDGAKRILTCYASKAEVMCQPNGKTNVEKPLIQVIFNESDLSVEATSQVFAQVMNTLKTEYEIENVNIVAHSMGGLVSAKYIEDYAGLPKVKKLVTIGTPFHGIRKYDFHQRFGQANAPDLYENSMATKDLLSDRQSFDSHIKVLAIAGKLSKHGGDGLVTVRSATGIKDIIKDENYSEKIIKDERSSHSGLHEHEEVDKYVSEFVWQASK